MKYRCTHGFGDINFFEVRDLTAFLRTQSKKRSSSGSLGNGSDAVIKNVQIWNDRNSELLLGAIGK